MAVALTPFDLISMAVIAVGLGFVFRKGMPKAYALGLVIMGLFGMDVVAQLFGARPPAIALAFRASDVVRGQGVWTIVTSMFAHAGLWHMVGNLVILLTAGPALEDRIGEKRFLVVYFTAGLVAVLAHLVLAYTTPFVSADSLALGASGAIFGVLTTFAVRHPRERLPLLLFFFILWVPSFMLLLIYLGMNLLYLFGFGGSGVAWWGHFAGFLAGLAFAYTIRTSNAPAKGRLPDPEKLAHLATTPDTKRILDRIRQFSPDTLTSDDAVYADAWLGRFFDRATCPTCGESFERSGLSATCRSGETTVAFARDA